MYKLPRRRMLKDKKDFQRVRHCGRSYADRCLVMYVLKDAGELSGMAAFAAGKKLGCAVVRTRMKRIMREAYRLNQDKIVDSAAVILVGRKAAIGVKSGVMEKSFLKLAGRAGILKGSVD